jgi:hypothetical protein
LLLLSKTHNKFHFRSSDSEKHFHFTIGAFPALSRRGLESVGNVRELLRHFKLSLFSRGLHFSTGLFTARLETTAHLYAHQGCQTFLRTNVPN